MLENMTDPVPHADCFCLIAWFSTLISALLYKIKLARISSANVYEKPAFVGQKRNGVIMPRKLEEKISVIHYSSAT